MGFIDHGPDGRFVGAIADPVPVTDLPDFPRTTH